MPNKRYSISKMALSFVAPGDLSRDLDFLSMLSGQKRSPSAFEQWPCCLHNWMRSAKAKWIPIVVQCYSFQRPSIFMVRAATLLTLLHMGQSRRKQKDESCIKSVVRLLTRAAQSIQRRQELNIYEGKGVDNAFSLLRSGVSSSNERTASRQHHYYKFLQRVQELCGLQVVALCAIELGQSKVGDFSMFVRSELPARLQEKRSQLNCVFLANLVTTYSYQGACSCRYQTELTERLRTIDIAVRDSFSTS